MSDSGALAATGVGAAVLYGCGWWGGALLMTFFVGSTLVSRATKDPAVARGEAKGNTRDWAQVLANGGAPALGALLERTLPGVGIIALSAGLAAAAADTWATSIGTFSPTLPRHLLTWQEVPAGTSGGVTWHGTGGALLGAGSIAIVTMFAVAITDIGALGVAVAIDTLAIGVAMMFVDSWLGARLQGKFHCGQCNEPTERLVHRCGTPTQLVSGVAWIGNDAVNALATTLGTALGPIVFMLFWGSRH